MAERRKPFRFPQKWRDEVARETADSRRIALEGIGKAFENWSKARTTVALHRALQRTFAKDHPIWEMPASHLDRFARALTAELNRLAATVQIDPAAYDAVVTKLRAERSEPSQEDIAARLGYDVGTVRNHEKARGIIRRPGRKPKSR